VACYTHTSTTTFLPSLGDEVLNREYGKAEIVQLNELTGDDRPVLAVADFSPGPWWGFNGVQIFVLTTDQLHMVQKGAAFTHGRLRRSIPTSSLEKVDWHIRRRFSREAVRMTLKKGSRRRTYTSKYQQGASLARELALRSQRT